LKPIAGRLTTTTDHTIQTAKASSSAGIEIQRLRAAIRRPVRSQKLPSSGAHSASTAPCGCSSGRKRRSETVVARSMRRMALCIQARFTAAMRNSSMKQLVQSPVRSFIRPKAIGSTKPPSPPIMPTTPPTGPT
jgi:hypothetical protein